LLSTGGGPVPARGGVLLDAICAVVARGPGPFITKGTHIAGMQLVGGDGGFIIELINPGSREGDNGC
jgi:hypothetical protein